MKMGEERGGQERKGSQKYYSPIIINIYLGGIYKCYP